MQSFQSLHKAWLALQDAVKLGGDARVRPVSTTQRFYNVRLTGYADRQAAVADLDRLARDQIDTQLIALRDGDAYDISAGLFSRRGNAVRLQERLHELGYDNLQLLPVDLVHSVYVLEVRRSTGTGQADAVSAPPPAAAQSPPPGPPPSAAPDEADDVATLAAEHLPAPPGRRRGAAAEGEAGGNGRLSASLDSMRVETGWLTRGGQPVYGSHYLRAMGHLAATFDRVWQLQLGARVDGYYQLGRPSVNQTQLDYAPSYLRYDGVDTRITVGAQEVTWGRTDEFPPNDQLSVKDISRFILYPMEWRQRAVPAIRLEQYMGSFKADVLWEPVFRRAKLPPTQSIWYPVDFANGRIISVTTTPVLSELVRTGKFTREGTGAGGAGIRLSASAARVDYAVTIQRAPYSLPYYKFDPTVRALLLSGVPIPTAIAATGQTFTEVHPWSWFIGSDAAVDALSATWRLEAAYISNVPVTTTSYRYTTEPGVDWAAEVEFFPGDSNTRVDIQLSGQELFNPPPVLDHINIYSFGGQIETPFLHDRWKAGLRFLYGLDRRNIYINPELAYTAWEPHEFYIDYHYFAGAAGTAGGFHQRDDLVTLGWRARY